MTHYQRIRKEFDEPFAEVIKGFAIMGYSRRATAQIVEIPLATFLRYAKRFGVHDKFKSQSELRSEFRGGPLGKTWRVKNRKRKAGKFDEQMG